MTYTSGTRSRSRPLGITILCILGFLGVIPSLFKMVGVLGQGGPFAVIGLVGLVLVVGKGIVLAGLWTLQRWAHTWALVFYGLSAVLDLVSLSLVTLVIDVLIVTYLVSKTRYFR